MKFERSSGVILHPTSLPGPYGIGDIGPQAERWVDFLDHSGCKLWQILPLGPTGYGDSPYQCFSAFAGNPYLISPELLLNEALLTEDDLSDLPSFPDTNVDFGRVIPWKLKLLDKAFDIFRENEPTELRQGLSEFQQEQSSWLDDFALFMALKEYHGGSPWVTWESGLRDRQTDSIQRIREHLSEAIEKQIFRQFIFFLQWGALREYAKERNILIIGDIPIFVTHDSADVWSHPELFYLDRAGNPEFVAGVPPDYFSPTGQLWGNPLYRWDVHQADGYQWWLNRIQTILNQVDIVRLDHFRGFAGYWEVPGKAKTAEKGRWVPGPGKDFFNTLKQAMEELPIIAEDLGVITPDVVHLRDSFNLPGMKILQFAFAGGPSDVFLPHHYTENCVVYTGTHDNDTVLGWYGRVPEDEKDFYRRYLHRDGSSVAWDLIHASWASIAVFSIAPLQDILGLDNQSRMNYPGNPSGNWAWRFRADRLSEDLEHDLYEVNYLYSRLNGVEGEEDIKVQAESEVPEDYFELDYQELKPG